MHRLTLLRTLRLLTRRRRCTPRLRRRRLRSLPRRLSRTRRRSWRCPGAPLRLSFRMASPRHISCPPSTGAPPLTPHSPPSPPLRPPLSLRSTRRRQVSLRCHLEERALRHHCCNMRRRRCSRAARRRCCLRWLPLPPRGAWRRLPLPQQHPRLLLSLLRLGLLHRSLGRPCTRTLCSTRSASRGSSCLPRRAPSRRRLRRPAPLPPAAGTPRRCRPHHPQRVGARWHRAAAWSLRGGATARAQHWRRCAPPQRSTATARGLHRRCHAPSTLPLPLLRCCAAGGRSRTGPPLLRPDRRCRRRRSRREGATETAETRGGPHAALAGGCRAAAAAPCAACRQWAPAWRKNRRRAHRARPGIKAAALEA